MPQTKGHNATLGVPNTPGPHCVRQFSEIPPFAEYPYAITGITKDSTGAVLGNCVVTLFNTLDNTFVSQTTSDANGNYTLSASKDLTHYAVSYKVGAPDVAGTTVNTLVGT